MQHIQARHLQYLSYMKQLTLLREKKYRYRKCARAVSTRSPNHVTLSARVPVLRRHHVMIKQSIREAQLKTGVMLRSCAIMERHLHLLIEAPTRAAFANFLRIAAGTIALRAVRGRLWLERAWSRVVRWGRDYVGVINYIEANPVKAGCFDDIDAGIVIRGGILEAG